MADMPHATSTLYRWNARLLSCQIVDEAGIESEMPTLDWIGKRAVVNHHREVPYRLLHCDKTKSVGDPDAGNLLVQGDNLEALKALLPYYAGKVKCIYIDPPYNTGNEGWVTATSSSRIDRAHLILIRGHEKHFRKAGSGPIGRAISQPSP